MPSAGVFRAGAAPRQTREPWPWLQPLGPVVLAVALAAVLLPTGVVSVLDSGLGAGWRGTLVAALVLLHLAPLPPLATRWPVVAFGVGSLVMLVLVAAPSLAGSIAAEAGGPVPPVLLPSGLVWFVLLHGVAAHSAPPWPGLALAGGLAGCVLASVRLWDDTSFETSPWGGDLGWRLFLLAAVVGGTLAAWSLGRFRATRLAWQAATAERAAAAERRRIAREMHDVVAHSLAVVVAQAEGGRLMVRAQPERAPQLLEDIATQGREALAQMRGLLGVLREDAEAVGPEPPQPTVADVPELVGRMRATGRRVTLETVGDPRPLGPAQELTAHRVVQEALTNVVKHAAPDATARVTLDWTDGLTITVTDDGPHRHTPVDDPTGVGLIGMRERVEAVGGTLEHGRGPEGGWRTCARIPA